MNRLIKVLIQTDETIYYPMVTDAKLTLERKCTPGKLTFTVIKDTTISFLEGHSVTLHVNDAPVFFGFVFSKKRNKDGTIAVTAYDQLRYLRNKDTYTAQGITASELLKRLAEDFRLRLGEIEDTGYRIATIKEENQMLFDMLQNALDETLLNTGDLYVMYDDAGALSLRNVRNMQVPLLIDEDSAENMDYESSIDAQTYNRIKLSYDNDETAKRELYIVQDSEKINRWGVLQYYENLRTDIGAAAKAGNLLKLYSEKTRRLTIKGAIGDPRVRAGSLIAVSLGLGDIPLHSVMLVERVTHTFSPDRHSMDINVVGGDFIA